MEIRFHHIFLIFIGLLVALSVPLASADEQEQKPTSTLRVNSELFDISLITGVLNIEDFPSEWMVGASVSFKASESFFLQYNYLQSDIGESSIEKNPAAAGYDLSSDRSFTHYDLLIGYTIFHGEFFTGDGGDGRLSSLYTVAGIGDTEFGDESNFTYTLGLGYKIEFSRKYSLRVDFRDHIYTTSLVVGADEKTVHNTQLSLGFGFMF